MSLLIIGVLIVICGLIYLKNKNKIDNIFNKVKVNKDNRIELSIEEISELRDRKMQKLVNRRAYLLHKLEMVRKPYSDEIKELDMEIYILENSK